MKTIVKEYKEYILKHKKKNHLGVGQTIYKFDNDYGASVIKEFMGPGVELAVIQFTNDKNWELEYSTSVTNDVLRNLTPEQLIEKLEEIKNLGVMKEVQA
ncbi:hypothetical protein LL50_05410 [Listeria monocytogenes]|nr:hypothetical protein [Listeria monocytogenes]EAD0383106.1 hypothetical protein [Listeria monocytogenes]EAF2023449.1 hypothetical protein [Listeria monocytogenes]EAH0455631.1 hypothetical protein [Listeria monocytogenes]